MAQSETVDDHLKFAARQKRRIISEPDVPSGEPVFKGTRISVRHVGELARKGVSLSILLEDFPRLAKSDIELARDFVARAKPPGHMPNLKRSILHDALRPAPGRVV
jgi:uncharacterized protein (DUF433 family)